MGLDVEAGAEPFELTKRFIDLAPGAFPGYSLLTAFGEAAPINFQYQLENRVIGFPFHFLNNHGAMNMRPKHYAWPAFYRHVIDLTRHSFSHRAIVRRIAATKALVPRWLNVVRAISSEGYGRIRYYSQVHQQLLSDRAFRGYFEQESDILPSFFERKIREDLGPMWHSLPQGALHHDPYAYLKSQGTYDREAAVAVGSAG
jgi:hypothetical protein